VKAMHVSLNLYAEHEFNASTFTGRVIAGTGSDLYSCITGAIGALRGPKARRRQRSRLEVQKRYETPEKPKRTSRPASSARKSSSASATRSTDQRSAQQGDQGGRAANCLPRPAT